MRDSMAVAASIALSLTACTGGDEVAAPVQPPGEAESAKTDVLEAGATILQDSGQGSS